MSAVAATLPVRRDARRGLDMPEGRLVELFRAVDAT